MSVRLNFESFGEGRPLIILHGLFGSTRNWRSMAKELARDFRVFTLDLRNHGNSGHTDTMYYMEMVDDLRQFLRDRSLEQACFIGHSMGGKAAMAFALEYAELTERLVVLDIAPVQYENEFEHLVDALLSVRLEDIDGRNQANELLVPIIRDGGLRLFLLQNLVRTEHGLAWRVNLPAIKAALPDISAFPTFTQSARYTGPSLFLSGENSPYILPPYHNEIRSFFPAAEIVTIPAADHWLHADQPGQVLREMRRFLQPPGNNTPA